jgi:hypothetical protein
MRARWWGSHYTSRDEIEFFTHHYYLPFPPRVNGGREEEEEESTMIARQAIFPLSPTLASNHL